MVTIEPCCYTKQLSHLFRVLNQGSQTSVAYATNSDWTLAKLLEWIIWLAPSGTISLILPAIDSSTIDMLTVLLSRKNVGVGVASKPLLCSVNLILSKNESRKFEVVRMCSRFPGKINVAYDDTDTQMLIITGDNPNDKTKQSQYVFTGGLNQTIDHKSRFVTVSRDVALYNDVMESVNSKLRVHKVDVNNL